MLRCGLIGYGAWGAHHARVIAGSGAAQLTAIAARSEETLARAKADHPQAHTYANWCDMLAQEDLQAVAIVLPSHLHFAAARDVLEAGKHLLLEKPMCLTPDECTVLNDLARKAGLVLAVGHEMRVSSLWSRVKQEIDAGTIGRPLYVLVELWRKPYRLGADGWRYDIERVGNWILEEPIHFFDLARWYFQGTAEPVGVFAQANGKRADHPELQDHFSAMVTFTGGGVAVIAQCLGGWEHHQTVKVSGTEGSLWAAWSGAMDRTFEPTFSLKVLRGDKPEEIPIPRTAGEVYELEDQFRLFAEAVQGKAQPAATGEDGLWSVLMCLKAEESARTGSPMRLK